MSNYISNENQRLLWKMAHQIPLFAQLDVPKKEFEFKKVVEYFYRKLENRPFLTTFELQQLNRETLSVFLPKPPSLPPTVPSVVPYEMVESRQDKSMRAFQERQNVYETMNKKPDLPNPEEIFREKNTEEEKIQNMDELILNYQKQREVDFHTIAPPNILPQSVKVNKLKLLEETILTENDVDDIDKSNKKSVSWNQSLTETMDSPKSLRILSLENKIIELENKIDFCMNQLREKKKIRSVKKEEEEVNIVLNDMVHKIERMDKIKNKMKLFS
jgi:K+/H+ antiporter YhaU regulatory subunit KhtT